MHNYVKDNSTIIKTKSFNYDLSQNKTFSNKYNKYNKKNLYIDVTYFI